MTAPKRVRWNCPNDLHPGVLGSTRPPKDSVVRYCLPCSEKTGRLVLRVAPALEREREAARQRTDAKAKRYRAKLVAAEKRARERENARYTVEGVDLRDEMTRLLRLKAWDGKFGKPGPDGGFHRRPELTVTRRTTYPGTLGMAYLWEWRINLATYPGQTLADARETLVHELAHLAVGSNCRTHGSEFNALMTKAFKEAYKVLPLGVRENRYHGRYAAALRRKEQAVGNV